MVCITLPVQQEIKNTVQTMNRHLIINFALFQAGWFACVLGGAYDHVIAGCLVASGIIGYHLYRAVDTSRELRLLMLALVIGLVFESIVTYLGLAVYGNGLLIEQLAPVWIILMWPMFATTLNISMRWLKTMPFWMVGVIGGAFAPFAYYAGNSLGAVVYDDLILSLLVIASAWTLLLPVMVMFSLKYDGYNSSAMTRGTREQAQHV